MKIIILLFCTFSALFSNWVQVIFPDVVINGILFDNNEIYMINFHGDVYQSENNGLNWYPISYIPNVLPYGFDVFEKLDDYLLVIQNTFSNNNIYRSYFNGEEWEEWEQIFSLTSNIFNPISYNNYIYVISDNFILVSPNYGDSWNIINSPEIDGYPNLLMVDNEFIYINYGCNLFRAPTSNYFWENISYNLSDIGPDEPYSCTTINDIGIFNNDLIISVYWYGGVGTLLRNENNQSEWIEIESFPAEYSNGYKYNIPDFLSKNGVFYAGTASSENGIFYTEDLSNWVEYSNGLNSYNLSVNNLYSTNEKIYKTGGTVNYFINDLILAPIVGDLNLDNNINIIDIIILVNHVLSSPAIELDGADINDDDNIDIIDIVELIYLILN